MKKAENYNSLILENLLAEITEEEQKKTDKKMLLAVKIDEAIKAKGWKKKNFAQAMNKRPSEISKWLSGTHNFTIETLFDIEDILNISIFNFEEIKKEKLFYFENNNISKLKNKSVGSC